MPSSFRSIEQQKDLLRARGLIIQSEEETALAEFLLNVNYYRASGYWRLFFNDPNRSNSEFRTGTTFQQIKRLYDWDVELRSLLVSGLALYEITFRARFAHFFAMQCAPDSYQTLATFNEVYKITQSGVVDLRRQTLKAISRDLNRSFEPAIVNALVEDVTPPIWVSIESLSMGTVSKMYSVTKDDIRFQLSRSLKLPHPEIADSLFHSFSVFRNHLAHHGQVWHYVPLFPPKVLKSLKVDEEKGIYDRTAWGLIVSLVHQLETIDKLSDCATKIKAHIESEPELKRGLTHPRY